MIKKLFGMIFKYFLALIAIIVFIVGCSASTGSRYEKTEEKKTPSTTEVKKDVSEDFNITPYETEISIDVPPISINNLPPDVWYEYNTEAPDSAKEIIGTTDGYRVQVLSTDDIDEANLVRSEIFKQTTRKEVYVFFEPPFYKVKVGDFTSKADAENLRFKLNQLGFTESKVVQETVNVFQ